MAYNHQKEELKWKSKKKKGGINIKKSWDSRINYKGAI